jgi:hypothetical protein
MPHPLTLPNRVSRLYPIFSLVLLLSSASFLYAWQTTRIELSNIPQVEEKNKVLQSRVDQLTADQKNDRATLQVQKQQITDTAAKLADLQKQLLSKAQEVATKDGQLKNQQDQLTQNSAELEKLRTRPPLFSFQNNSSLTNIDSKEADVKTIVTSAYDYIVQMYGTPYLLNSITITFVDGFSISGSSGEIVISNSQKGISVDIHLKDFDKTNFQDINTVIHEMIHAFHGVAVLENSALEEGMTVAATDAVMQKMIADKKLPAFNHLYLTISPEQYTTWNTSLKIPATNSVFYTSPDISKIYQVIGLAWFKLYLQDSDFFKKFNAYYYPKIQKGQTADHALVLDDIRSVMPTIGSQSIDTFLSLNNAFNPN